MAVQPLQLRNPPIVEAVIVIDFTPLPPETMAKLPQVVEELAPRYHQPAPIFEQKVQFDATGRQPPSHESLPFGVRFVSEDARYQVQLRRDAFIFSRLAPYESWLSFKTEAQSVWEAFLALVTSPTVISFGLRYVNKISFPAAQPIERYLKLYPAVPDSPFGGPQAVNGGHLRLQMPLENPPGLLIVQQVMLPAESEGMFTIALDNDFRFSGLGVDHKAIWERLDQARQLKNDYFVHFITEQLLETYK
jgi:uncharacterized protein (TIGR04255 family)